MRSKIGAGVVAGLLAGLVYGVVMQVVTIPMPGAGGMPGGEMPAGGGMSMSGEGRMPMMAMVAQVVRSDSLVVGWVFLMLMGMAMGAVFAWLFGARAARPGGGLRWGLLYGVFWWVAGTLVLMPVLLGMPAFAPLRTPMLTGALWSLVAYLLAGPLLGLVFAALYRGDAIAAPPA